jgi:SPP1 gp7 family putative phage head morphogenesis protein
MANTFRLFSIKRAQNALKTLATVLAPKAKEPEIIVSPKPMIDNGQNLSSISKKVYRYQVDLTIQNWRSAIAAALNPGSHNRILLHQLYYEALYDNHLRGQIKTMVVKVVGSPFAVLDATGKINQELTQLFKRPWFEKFLTEVVMTTFWGHSLIELGQQDFENLKLKLWEFSDCALVPRELVWPVDGKIALTQNSPGQINFRDYPFNKYLIETGDPLNIGDLQYLIPDVIWKRYARNDSARRSEKFGMPITIFATNETREPELQARAKMAENLGVNGWAVINKENDEMNLLDTKGTGDGHKIYFDIINLCNEEISKGIVGGTMTNSDGSSRSQAEVHERILSEWVEAEMRKTQNAVNFLLIPKLIAFGYPLDGCQFVFNTFLQEIMNPGASALMEAQPVAPAVPHKPGQKPPIPLASPKGAIENFTKPSVVPTAEGKAGLTIAGHITAMRVITAEIDRLPDMPEPDPDFSPEKYTAVFEQHLTKVYDAADEAKNAPLLFYQKQRDFIVGLARLTGSRLSKVFTDTFTKAEGTHFQADAPSDYLELVQSNLYTFSSAKSVSELITLRDLLYKEDGSVRPFSDFRTKAFAVSKEWNETWLEAEYNQVFTSAQMASIWKDIERTAKLYPFLRYNAVIDKNTTKLCQSLNGITRRFDDAFWNTYYPPNHWNCRAGVTKFMETQTEPTPDDTVKRLTEKHSIEPYFALNVGKTGRTVSDLHPYFVASDAATGKAFVNGVAQSARHSKS